MLSPSSQLLCAWFFSIPPQTFTQKHNIFAHEEGIFLSEVICATVSDLSFLQTRLIITTLCNNADTGVTIPTENTLLRVSSHFTKALMGA